MYRRHTHTHFMTEHRVLTVGTHRAGQNTRAERKEERFGQVRTQRTRKTGLGLSRGGGGGETEEEILGDDRLLYLAPENHKDPGLLQRVS